MVITKDQPHGPVRSVSIFIVVECEDHSAFQAPHYISRYNNRENVLVSKLYILLILDKLIGYFHTN